MLSALVQGVQWNHIPGQGYPWAISTCWMPWQPWPSLFLSPQGNLTVPALSHSWSSMWCMSASWSCKTDNQQQGRTCTPKEQQFAMLHKQPPDQHLSSDCQANCEHTFISPSLSFTLQTPNLRGETVLSLFLALDVSGFALSHGWGPQLLNQHLAGVSSDCRVSISCLCCTDDGLGYIFRVMRNT